DYFKGGWLVYSNQAKVEMLQVDSAVIEKEGAVSEQVAGQLASNCRRLAGSDFGIGITGIAGPGGGSELKPVGLVYIGLADEKGVTVERQVFGGDRAAVRLRAANFAMNMLRLRLGR
ncbi:MAG: nicotinamide-nucleotide amidohydrolase family protein, partial [Sedimentisphaerales bacterium]|nr:nicotinamide-nucleotide amidohydrolase family protein [Sedimentisphaerales bacterium]